MSNPYDIDSWTYGAEHELADWPLGAFDRLAPLGFTRDTHDITIVNSNGIANDPSGRYYEFGGEICTPPSKDLDGQLSALAMIKDHLPSATVNYRSNLHIHIRVPGLGERLDLLKQVQEFIHYWMPKLLPIVEPLERPTAEEFPDEEELAGALRRWRRRRVSHQTLLTNKRLSGQVKAQSVEEFFELEVPKSRAGKPLWHCQPRLCVNLRQILQTDTVEFRHFPGTLKYEELQAALQWCQWFMFRAVHGMDISSVDINTMAAAPHPKFMRYDHDLETKYRMTVHDGTVPKDQIRENINKILEDQPCEF